MAVNGFSAAPVAAQGNVPVTTLTRAEPRFAVEFSAVTHILPGLDNVAAFKARMEADAGVRAALAAEGLA